MAPDKLVEVEKEVVLAGGLVVGEDAHAARAGAGLTSLIEPLLIVFLGVVIGFIVIAMFMPMFKMIELLAH